MIAYQDKNQCIEMNKNVYSLVLMDEVVDKIDELAYSRGTSRSNLINQILAEYVSCVTPQQRNRQLFDCFNQSFSNIFIVAPQTSDMFFSMRRALKYKYNPTIRYRIELFEEPKEYIGILKVSLRTQNARLIELLSVLFAFVIKFEKQYLNTQGEIYKLENGNFSRMLEYPEKGKVETAIVNYINFLDNVIQFYFANINNPDVLREIEKMYKNNEE